MTNEIETEREEVTTVATSTPEKVIKTKTKLINPPVQIGHPQKVFEKKKTIFRTYQIIWLVLAIIEVLLGFRMTLKALGANPLSGFTNLIYTLSDPLALPFSGILNVTISGSTVYEWSTLIAAAVYAIIAYGIIHLLQLMKPVTPSEVEETVDNT